ncbi:hypothetical protein ABZP36_031455 [Zizania latifolia]
MDAARASLLLAGGLAVSTSAIATAAQSVLIPHLYPYTRRRGQRRFLRLASAVSSSPTPLPVASAKPHFSRWIVVTEKPHEPAGGGEVPRAEAVNYYVATLARVLGSQEEAQMRIYDASWNGSYQFCCEIGDEASRDLAKMPEVLAVRPDKDDKSEKDNRGPGISAANLGSFSDAVCSHSSSSGEKEFWLVRMEKPGVEVVTKAQMVDHYTQILMKVLGKMHKSAYITFHGRDYGFCCHIDEECAKELADIPGVLSVQPDTNFGSDNNKNYKGDGSFKLTEASQGDVKTKRLFVTGLSFYTSEKTLRAAFEPFGELFHRITVKIIMDKISKRSKGYAFIEYTTEEAGGAALKAMNGQVEALETFIDETTMAVGIQDGQGDRVLQNHQSGNHRGPVFYILAGDTRQAPERVTYASTSCVHVDQSNTKRTIHGELPSNHIPVCSPPNSKQIHRAFIWCQTVNHHRVYKQINRLLSPPMPRETSNDSVPGNHIPLWHLHKHLPDSTLVVGSQKPPSRSTFQGTTVFAGIVSNTFYPSMRQTRQVDA